MTFIKEPDGLPVKIQFAEGSTNVSVTTPQQFAETSENWEAS